MINPTLHEDKIKSHVTTSGEYLVYSNKKTTRAKIKGFINIKG